MSVVTCTWVYQPSWTHNTSPPLTRALTSPPTTYVTIGAADITQYTPSIMAIDILPLSITLEEHFSSRASQASEAGNDDPLHQFPHHITSRLEDLHVGRIKNMDDNGVAIQVVLHTPNASSPTQTIIDGNDELAEAIRANPTRLAGFAQLPMLDPAAAGAELERCVKQFGFVGALVDNQADGTWYDGVEYAQFWAKVEDLGVPIYLHPSWPSKAMAEALYSGGGLETRPEAATAIGAYGFGWHASTATTILRLLGSGVFDDYPRLKVIIGHSGELLPYMFDRINRACGRLGQERSFAEVMHSNIWITTSGMFDIHSLRCLLGVMPAERVMFSVDYPFSDNRLGKEYLETIRREKVLNDEQLQAFAFGNARKLLFQEGHANVLVGPKPDAEVS